MKKQLLNPTFLLTGAALLVLAAGCASPGYSDLTGPRSALAFTTVTTPSQNINWTGDRYLFLSLRSIDTYYFQVPDTGYEPGGVEPVAAMPGTTVVTPGAQVTTPAGTVETPNVEVTTPAVGAPGPYQTASGGYKVIEYRPGHGH